MTLVGIDEVGRGCWAGPLVAAAVILPENFTLKDGPLGGGVQLRDSKKLSKKQRDQLAEIIHSEALAVGIGWVWPEAIDTGGISAAVKTAMAEALAEIDCDYDEVIIDGNINYLPEDSRTKAVIKADDSYPAVSAASIVAKVARDNYMAEAATHYPGYGFEAHVGYGTAVHIAALHKLGVTDIHRLSYKPIQALVRVHA